MIMSVREAEEIARFKKYYCPDTARRAKERLLACRDNYYHELAETIDPNDYIGVH